MDENTLNAIITAGIVLVGFVFTYLVSLYVDRSSRGKVMRRKTHILVKKSLGAVVWLVALIAIALIWGVNIQNVWVVITGILAIVAIGFFAVWSILSNVLAAIILFFSNHFNLDETIEIIPDGIKGRVDSINMMFTILKDEKGNTINVPNSLLLQRVVKRYK